MKVKGEQTLQKMVEEGREMGEAEFNRRVLAGREMAEKNLTETLEVTWGAGLLIGNYVMWRLWGKVNRVLFLKQYTVSGGMLFLVCTKIVV